MPEGLHRFQVYLAKLDQIFKTLPSSGDRALTLYQSPARQYLFYLEALTHVYELLHNHKRFERMRLWFKSLEDQLGKIDYFDGFIKEFSAQENFPTALLDRLRFHKSRELSILDDQLKKDGWLNKENGILSTIESELPDADWKTNPEEKKAIGGVIINVIDKIKADYHSGKLNFNDIENGVHEFRRQVRWISIYAQALDGLIQLNEIKIPEPKLVKYLTKEVLESPFNKLPPPRKGVDPIYIEGPHFYALSWLIAEAGRLKDNGLRIILIEDLIRETGYTHEKNLKQVTKSLAIKSTQSLREIKESMKEVADKFIHHDKVLDRIEADIRASIVNRES